MGCIEVKIAADTGVVFIITKKNENKKTKNQTTPHKKK